MGFFLLTKIILFLLIFVLSGCITFINNRVPNGFVCKSISPYEIDGLWFYPKITYNYKEDGLASWYGSKFHGKIKACGEVYNQNHMGAAHRTLPLPCIVQVTNILNGKKIELIIDDRGPFIETDKRIIDLSKASARALGFLKQGLTPVKIKVLQKKSEAFARYLYYNFGMAGIDPSRKRSWHDLYWKEISPNF